MPRGVRSYSKLTVEQIVELQKQLEAEKVKREKMSASNGQVAAIVTAINKLANELGVAVPDLVDVVVKAAVGANAYVGQRKGRKPRDPNAPKKPRGRPKKK